MNCTHEEFNDHVVLVHTNQLKVMVDRCKRFTERLRTVASNDTVVKNGYQVTDVKNDWSVSYNICT